jgi:preprotein translocase subunit SecY
VARRESAAFRHRRRERAVYFGGTSLLIVVGVAMDTVNRSNRN